MDEKLEEEFQRQLQREYSSEFSGRIFATYEDRYRRAYSRAYNIINKKRIKWKATYKRNHPEYIPRQKRDKCCDVYTPLISYGPPPKPLTDSQILRMNTPMCELLVAKIKQERAQKKAEEEAKKRMEAWIKKGFWSPPSLAKERHAKGFWRPPSLA